MTPACLEITTYGSFVLVVASARAPRRTCLLWVRIASMMTWSGSAIAVYTVTMMAIYFIKILNSFFFFCETNFYIKIHTRFVVHSKTWQ